MEQTVYVAVAVPCGLCDYSDHIEGVYTDPVVAERAANTAAEQHGCHRAAGYVFDFPLNHQGA